MSVTIRQAMLDSTSNAYSAQDKRAFAVAAALEVIAARATGPSGNVNLSYEFEQLSRYADQIQEALAAR